MLGLMASTDDDDVIPQPVYAEAIEHRHYTEYAAKGIDMGVGYTSHAGEFIALLYEDRMDRLAEDEFLMSLPDGDKSFELTQDELWAVITAFSNIEAKNPSFEEFFVSFKEFWKLIETHMNVPCPACIGDVTVVERRTFSLEDDFDEGIPDDEVIVDEELDKLFFRPHLKWDEDQMTFNERLVRMMIAITKYYGNYEQAFRRYVVINDEAITTDDLDEAVLEKVRLGGKLIDLASAS